MWKWRLGVQGLVGVCLVCAFGCNPGSGDSYGPPGECKVPCEDDPSEMCPCPSVAGPGMGQGSGGGGNGGSGGSGGTSGAGASSVDVTGTVVQLTTAAFDEVVPFADSITVIAPGVDTKDVQVDAIGGTFSLQGAASGQQWVLAKELDGVGGAFSTYTIQGLDGMTPITVPVVPVDVLDSIATQIEVPSLLTGTAQAVLEITDENGQALEGVALVLSGGSIGYDVAPLQYSAVAAGTGSLGRAVALNVPMGAPGELEVTLMVSGTPWNALVQMAPDTVTYTGIALDLTP
jgi:hypothetical protein